MKEVVETSCGGSPAPRRRRVIVTDTRFELDEMRERARADLGPSHLLSRLAEGTGADILQSGDVPPRRWHRLAGAVLGSAERWAVAEAAVRAASDGGFVYSTGEDVGVPIVLVNGIRRRAAIVVHANAPQRTQVRIPLRIARFFGFLPTFTTNTAVKRTFLVRRLKAPVGSVELLGEQTDESFFKPQEGVAGEQAERRALIVSCGLEQRDYDTLARAVSVLDVDVAVCATSPNAMSGRTVRMPSLVPDNMIIRIFDFVALRDLYRRADITAIVLLPNDYSAGLTVLMEAMACGSPVIITRTPGLAEELIDAGVVRGVPPGDADALRETIESMLVDRAGTRARAARAHRYFIEHHTSRAHLEHLMGVLEAVERVPRSKAPRRIGRGAAT